MTMRGAATVIAPAPAAAPAAADVPATAVVPVTGTNVAFAVIRLASRKALWIPPGTALEDKGVTSPLPTCAATFAGTTIRYSVSPLSATAAGVDPDLTVCATSWERWVANGLAACNETPPARLSSVGSGCASSVAIGASASVARCGGADGGGSIAPFSLVVVLHRPA